LWWAANAAVVRSRVQIGDAQRGTLTSTDRPLEGQSPWVGNVQLGTDDDELGLSVNVLYNVFGPRIVEVGALGLPDTIEQPFHQLDVVVRQKLPMGLLLGLQARNLLDLPSQRLQNGIIVDDVTRGRTFGLSLTWTY
jgi:outer membrane receptor protein involved in Fe transport